MADTTRSNDSTGEALMSYDHRCVVFGLVKGRCPVCRGRMTAPWFARCYETSMTIDHLEAYSSGGSNEIGNLIPLCASCNSSKCANELRDWLPGRLVERQVTSAQTLKGQLRFAAKVAAELKTLAREVAETLAD